MPSITVDPNTGRLLIDGVPANATNAYGQVGQALGNDRRNMEGADPNYYQELGGFLDESGNWNTRHDIRPDVRERMGGLTQLGQFGVGGFDEVKDPSQLIWNDEFGVMTDPSNISARDPATRRRGLSYLAAIGGGAALQGMGFLPGGESAGYGLGGSAGEAGAAGGMGGMEGAGLATDIAPGYLSESVAPQVTEAMAGSPFGGNSLWQSAMNYATSNPLSAARGVAGLLGAAGSAGGSQQTTGASGGFQGPPVGQFNPVGNAGQFQSNQSQYQPMQFDPVPFMGGSMYYNQQQPNFMGSWGGFNPNAMNFGGGYTPTQFQGGGMPAQSYSNGGFGGNTGGGMGYAGGGPNPFMSNPFGQSQQQPTLGNNQFSPVGLPGQPKPYMPPQFNMNQQQPQQGGLLGNVQTMAGGQPDGFGPNNPGQNPHYGRYANNGAFVADPSAGASQMDQSPLVPGMTNREVMGYARYLPGNKSPLDPLVSQNLLQKSGGNWQSMVPQRAQAGFQQFMNAFGNPQSFGDYQNFLKAR